MEYMYLDKEHGGRREISSNKIRFLCVNKKDVWSLWFPDYIIILELLGKD